jgi:hypothetical protein
MSEEVLRRIVERGDRDDQRRVDQERSIKPTEYIGNGYVKQLGQSPTRSRYLSNAGLVRGELVAPLGHGQQDVIIHKKPQSFTVAKQPQEIISIIPGDTENPEVIYNAWTDKPDDWYQFYDGGSIFRIVWKNPPSTPTPGGETFSYSQTITIPSSGQARIVSAGVDDIGAVTFNGDTLSLTFPGYVDTGFIYTDYKAIAPGNYPLNVTVTDIVAGGAGIGFTIEFVPDIIYISEE